MIYIKIEPPSDGIEDAIAQALEFCSKNNVAVSFSFNGVEMLIRKEYKADDLLEFYRKVIALLLPLV